MRDGEAPDASTRDSSALSTRSAQRSAHGSLSARPYEPSRILRWLYRRFFSHLLVDDAFVEAVREASSRGVVIYVMRAISVLDFLCLDFLIKRFGLPLIRFVNDLGLWILEPFGKGERRLRFRRQVPEDQALSDVVRGGHSALLFLRKPPRLRRKLDKSVKGEELEIDLLKSLVAAQRHLDEPILLMPQTFVWSMRPPSARRGIADLFFGPVEWPGRFRVFFQFLFNFRNARLRAGEPFDLSSFIDEHLELTDEQIADKIRYALLRRIERERTLVLGPTKKTPGRIQEELLRSPRVRSHMEARAKSTKRELPAVRAEAKKILNRLQANQQPYMVSLMHRGLRWVFTKIYDGIEVDQEGIARLRAASREGAVVLLPSHKSHVDYLVLSYVLYINSLNPPLIAAGDNLSFFPLGPALRRGGAFFIRRSFKGNRLYPALVDAYMRKLLAQGFAIEFFIEGGRSRTGKLRAPQFGLLSMVVDAAAMNRGKVVSFVPISIGYERVVESRSYEKELAGGEKKKEGVGGLLSAPEILRSRYGRLYVQFGEVTTFKELVDDARERHGVDGFEDLSKPQRRALIQRFARHTVEEIERVTMVTPAALVATALLMHRRKGVLRDELLTRCEQLLNVLDRAEASSADTLRDANGVLRVATIDEAITLFEEAGHLRTHDTPNGPIYRLRETRRVALEYAMNTVAHFFRPYALISCSLGAGSLTEEALIDQVERLAALVQPGGELDRERLQERIFEMVVAGELARDGDALRARPGLGRTLSEMLRADLEAIRLGLRAAAQLEEPTPKKEWVKNTLKLGEAMTLSGELELAETVVKPKLEIALSVLRALNVLALNDGDVTRGESHAMVSELQSELSSFFRE